MLEAGSEEPGTVVVDPDSAGDATHVGRHASGDGFGEFSFERNVTHRKATAWLEDADNLTEDSGLVRREVQNAIRDDAIDRSIRQRDAIDGGLVELDVCVSARSRVCSRPFNHGRSHVDADGPALWPYHLRSQKHIKPTA